MSAEQLRELFTVIQGGAEVAIENVETFAPDVSIPGAAELLGKTEAVTLGNGAAAEVSQLVTQTSATTATTAGVGLLALEMPTAIAAAVPFLGAFAGMTLYNLAPEFWTSVSNNLMQAGETVGGKLRAFVNSATGQVGFSEKALNIIKNTLINTGIFSPTIDYPSTYPVSGYGTYGKIYQMPLKVTNSSLYTAGSNLWCQVTSGEAYSCVITYVHRGKIQFRPVFVSTTNFTCAAGVGNPPSATSRTETGTFNGTTFYYCFPNWLSGSYVFNEGAPVNAVPDRSDDYLWGSPYFAYDIYQILFNGGVTPSEYVQPGAVTPNINDPISTTYPNLVPWNLPIELPTIYPIEVPVNNDNPTQQEAQNPNPDPEPSPFLDWLLKVLPQPAPNPVPQPVPPVDPDPQPVPLPLPVIDGVRPEPDPPDPNKPIPPSPIPIIPDLPTTVDSNAMFTVYAPSISQLNAFGGWLWSNNIIDMLLRIWQNPLEGIIAFQKVYAVPTVGSSSNIIVGYLDSEVAAPIVTSQFVTVNCGTITVDEILNNATDYPPYTMMHLYLPFIGIVELDCNEFMNGSITVTYHIDVYTGTCLVEVASTRSPDMATPTIIYTFSGNASQQLPLTSSNFGGALNALVSTVSGVARMGSGGALNAISGLSTIGHSVSHEMIHIAHSGDLSANAGIMALRTPYLIIGRRNSYDANAYNDLYGYPANKTVYLGNCSGFTRVKAGFLRSKATEEEKQEIMDLLKKGVIL